MRIVLDTSSNGWATFKRWSIGILILFVILFVGGVIEYITKWDMDFFQGYMSATHIIYYKWKG